MADFGKPGMKLGTNDLVRRIGKGGNSEVWLARSGDHDTVVKILRRAEAHRVRRFLDEIAFHSRYQDDGVLPLLESDGDGRVKWLSMPPATGIQDALADDWSPQRVIDIVRVYAETLARLADQNVSHRDLKPENLFLLDGKPVIGDFGLVDFPEKAEITGPEELMGPLHYHAPETLSAPLTADGKPADVWSLAKTLWVLLTGQTFPLPGEHRGGVPYDLNDWMSHPRVTELNALMVHCTRFAPTDRPPMASLAEALRPPATKPAELREDATLEELQARLVEVTQPSVEAAHEAELLRQRLAAADIALASHVGAVGLTLLDNLKGRFQEHPSEADYAGMRFGRDYTGRTHAQLPRNVLLYLPDDGRIKIVHSVKVDLLDPAGRMLLYAYLAVIEHFGHLDEPLVHWEEPPRSVVLGSAEFEDALTRFQTEVESRLPEALRKILEVVTRSKNAPPTWFEERTPGATSSGS